MTRSNKISMTKEQTQKKEELHPPETVTTLYLIRHGHTQATQDGLLYCDRSTPLTDKGFQQAKNLALHMSQYKIDHLVTGTALRAISTAEPIAQELGMKMQTLEGLDEWQVGQWEGRTYLDIKKNEPEIYKAWCADPISNAPPGGESVAQMMQRIKDRLALLLADNTFAGCKIALVTHSGIIRTILMQALNMQTADFWRLSIPTGSISRVDFSANFASVHFISLVPEGRLLKS
jgi:broad specificity phosphatase PhoE